MKEQSVDFISLAEYCLQQSHLSHETRADLTLILDALGQVAKMLHWKVQQASLLGFHGNSGTSNTHGEDQQKLDLYANEAFKKALWLRGVVCGLTSEEDKDHVVFSSSGKDPEVSNGQYVVAIDPIDGSSNIDVNIPIGTIFSVYRRKSQPGEPVVRDDFLSCGREQVMAGYVLYGSSSMLVLTTGNGVDGFTLDLSVGQFLLSHEVMRFPEIGSIYSINEGNSRCFSGRLNHYLDHCKSCETLIHKPYSARYVGSLVADFHRNLLKGGIFIYPALENAPNGKLRLLYECNPLAFVAEQAGGMANNGLDAILDIAPTELHQRSPLFIGAKAMMLEVQSFIETG